MLSREDFEYIQSQPELMDPLGWVSVAGDTRQPPPTHARAPSPMLALDTPETKTQLPPF